MKAIRRALKRALMVALVLVAAWLYVRGWRALDDLGRAARAVHSAGAWAWRGSGDGPRDDEPGTGEDSPDGFHDQALAIPAPRTDAVAWRILVVVVRRTALVKPPHPDHAEFTDDDIGKIRTTHRRFARWLQYHTGGGVVATTDLVIADEPLTELGGREAFWVSPRKLPAELDARVPMGRYHSAFAWARLPPSLRVHGGGATGGSFRGIRFSSVHRKALLDESIVVPSHEFYHQLTGWLRQVAPERRLPSNHPPATITVDGQELLPGGATREAWYHDVVGRQIGLDGFRQLAGEHQRTHPDVPPAPPGFERL